MKEVNFNTTSTWSKCGQQEKRPLRTDNMQTGCKNGKHNLDCIIGPRGKNDDAYIYNGAKLWDSWEHCPICARIRESAGNFLEMKKKERRSGLDGGRRQTRKLLDSECEIEINENLATMQKNYGDCLSGEESHYTKAERENITQQTPDNLRIRGEAAARRTTSQKSQSGTRGECCLSPGKEASARNATEL